MKTPEEYLAEAVKLFESANEYFLGARRNRTLNGDIYEGFLRSVIREVRPGCQRDCVGE